MRKTRVGIEVSIHGTKLDEAGRDCYQHPSKAKGMLVTWFQNLVMVAANGLLLFRGGNPAPNAKLTNAAAKYPE